MDIREYNFNAIPEHMKKEVKDAYKNKAITHEDLTLLSLSEVADVYNSIKDHLYGMFLNGIDLIIKRENIQEYLDNEVNYNKNVYNCFNILKSIGYIGVCGLGYIFDNDKITLTNAEHERINQLYFEIL